jgi:hypothetical protein
MTVLRQVSPIRGKIFPLKPASGSPKRNPIDAGCVEKRPKDGPTKNGGRFDSAEPRLPGRTTRQPLGEFSRGNTDPTRILVLHPWTASSRTLSLSASAFAPSPPPNLELNVGRATTHFIRTDIKLIVEPTLQRSSVREERRARAPIRSRGTPSQPRST